MHRLRVAAEAPDLSGTKYRLLEKLSRGGMGTIYLAEDVQLQRPVALKVMHLADATGEQAVRVLREARVIARLEHPGIVPVHDAGELPDGRVYYVMKFVHGQRLDQYAGAPRELPDRLRVFQKICEAVAFAHANGVVHRDLKPENIMVGAFGEVLVMDWGLAKILPADSVLEKPRIEDRGSGTDPQTSIIDPRSSTRAPHISGPQHQTRHGTVMGTPAYMAPEQRRGEIDQIDQRTDVYALGAILKFLLQSEAGTRAAAGASRMPRLSRAFIQASSLRSKIPKYLHAIAAQSMAEEKAQRYAGVRELAFDIGRFLDGLAVSSYQENWFEKLWRNIKQYRFILLLICAYVLARLLLIFLLHR